MSAKIASPGRLQQVAKKSRRTQEKLTQTILQEGSETAAAQAAAACITEASLTEAEINSWHQDMRRRLDKIIADPEKNLGFIEVQVAESSNELLRLLTQRAAQAKANATVFHCPDCHGLLGREHTIGRTVRSRYGEFKVYRHHGYCGACEAWHFPADLALGLQPHCSASPYLQEVTALLGSKMPSEQAAQVAERFGLDLSGSFIHRQALRQGIKAQGVRQARLEELSTWEGLQGLAKTEPATGPFTLVIEIDAWNIRERDHWGQTQAVREQAAKDKTEIPSSWHWVYVGTVFRLDHRAQTAGGRAVISQRGYVCTRLGIEALMRQLYRQAIDCGLGQAKDVLVVADGAVWIWNAACDRFPQARSRLDLYHADQHLWEVAHDLYGRGTPEARAWVEPLLKNVRRDEHQTLIRRLEEIQSEAQKKLQVKVQKHIDYFEDNAKRMNYGEIIAARKAIQKGTATRAQEVKASEPLGSGAIESTCRQYQCRFKRTGQFWSLKGDEALMCLETFWRNGQWHLLFPHAKPPPNTHN